MLMVMIAIKDKRERCNELDFMNLSKMSAMYFEGDNRISPLYFDETGNIIM